MASKNNKRDAYQEAFNAALNASGSKAKTDAGKQKAVAEFISNTVECTHDPVTDVDVLRWYTQSLIESAQAEMAEEFRRREWVKANRKRINQIPDFARFWMFKANLPAKLAARYAKVAGNYDSKTTEQFAHIRKAIKDLSFNVCEWGRVKNRNEGSNVIHDRSIEGYRTENKGPYSSRVTFTHYEYYADYTFIVSRDGRRYFYRLSDGTERTRAISPAGWAHTTDNRLVKPTPVAPQVEIKPRHIIRALSNHTHAPLTVGWDRERKLAVIRDGREEYHSLSTDFVDRAQLRNSATFRARVQQAVGGLRKRRAEKIEQSRLAAEAARTFVSLEDSLAAGNCKPLSESFAREMWQRIGATGACAVRGDLILATRNDNYTRRAVAAAIAR